jgi:hemolysin activation/secretion protein
VKNELSVAPRPVLAALIGMCPAIAAWAAPPPPAPNSGTILQQAQPAPAPTPAPNNSTLDIEQIKPSALPPSVPFRVSRIDITGNTRITTETLHALIAGVEGQRITLPELTAAIARITDYYHKHGYPLARAIVPAQTMREGVVHVEVIEAHYGKVTVDNRSRLSSRLLEGTLGDLKSGAVVTQQPLDRSLLLLSDIPGVSVRATLKPGSEVGSSDLVVDTQSPRLFTASATVDNSGDAYSGRARIGANVSVLEPFHQGDVLGLSALSSGGGMNYGRVSYDALLNGEGTRLGAGFSGLHYRLSGRLSDLDAHGDAEDAYAFVKQPIVRARDLNVSAEIQYDHLRLNDDIDVSDIETRRHLNNVTATLFGDLRDEWLTGGVNTWAASWTYGHVSFTNAAAESADATAADTQGDFSKWNLSLGRLQRLGPEDALYVNVSGQWANHNLDPSQQLILGGPTSVRAYDVSAIAGDTGWQVTTELRHTFPPVSYGQWQAVAFVDDAHVTINRNVFAPGPNTASLNGAGVGLNWTGPAQWTASAAVAAPIGSRPELIGNTNSVRAWAQLTKGF